MHVAIDVVLRCSYTVFAPVNRRFSFVRASLVVAAATTTVAFVLTYRTIRQSEASNAVVDNTEQRLAALVGLEAATGELIFAADAQEVRRAATVALARLDNLAALTAGDASQQTSLKSLRGEIEHVIHRRSDEGTLEGPPPVEGSVPHSLSRAMRAFRAAELTLLTERIAASTKASRGLRWALLFLAGASAALLTWVFGLVVRDEHRRRRAELALRHANEELDARVAARTSELHDSLYRERVLRRAAETSSQLKDDFLVTVSHELRTPLNALLGWADMLRLGMLPEHRQQRAIDAIYDNAKLQAQLIADLLDTGRILSGKLRIETGVVDLAHIVRDAVNVIAPAAQAKGLALETYLDPEIGPFVGDPSRLQQIVWNLTSNAVKFTQQGSICVRLERGDSDREVRIIVADTGQGISHSFLPHVFDRFRQEQTGTTRPHGGLGLGLAIARQLVELHGGTVRAESPGDGHGATFTVTLPRAHAPALARPEAPGAEDGSVDRRSMPVLRGVHVLVVDDDAAAREMVTAALEYCGAAVTTAASAVEARQRLAEESCDVLLVDIAMPGEDGYAFIRDIRARGLRQPAAALTAQARDVDRDQALRAGFDTHICKPVEAHPLALAVASLVEQARATIN
jgi:signal transduction histidine kinase/ActR/RegA family two-component response regulator